MVNANSILKLFVTIGGLILAVLLGNLLVTDTFTAFIWIGLVSILVLCLWMGKNIWLLIPATMYVSLAFPWMPADFTPFQLTVGLVVAWSFLLILMRRLPLGFRMTQVEWAAVLLLLTILQGYVRNPVGMAVLGTASVGAKPYFNVIIALFGALLLGSLKVEPKRIRQAMWMALLGMGFSTAVNLAAYLSQSVARVTGPWLGAWGKLYFLAASAAKNDVVDPAQASRIQPAVEGSALLSRWISSKRNPLTALLSPLWAVGVLTALAVAGMSGFRNVLFSTILTFAVATYYWGRSRAVLAGMILAVTAYIMIALVNGVAPLPPNIQRTLSVLPGTWDERYKKDATESTDWRVEMWKQALFTDRYIHNKILGDGLGMTQQEFRYMASLKDMKYMTDEMSQERAMIAGDYHSGPVSTIRTVGYAGLLILLYTMIVVSVRAHKFILQTRGTKYFCETLFFLLPMVWHPLFFVFVFGHFGNDVPVLLMNIGLLRLLERNLPPALADEKAAAMAKQTSPGVAGGFAPARS